MQSVFQARRLGKSTFPRSILPFQGDSATWTLATNSSTELYNSKILNMFEHDSKQLFGHAELSLFTWRFPQIVLIVLYCFFFLCLQGHHKHNVQSPAANLDAARVQAICSSGLQLHGDFLHRFSDSAFSQFISIYSISYLASVEWCTLLHHVAVTWKLVKVQLPRMFLHVWRNRCPDERTEWRLKPSYQILSDALLFWGRAVWQFWVNCNSGFGKSDSDTAWVHPKSESQVCKQKKIPSPCARCETCRHPTQWKI